MFSCKLQGHLLEYFQPPNLGQSNLVKRGIYLKALLSEVLYPGMVHLAKSIGVTPGMVCIHCPFYLVADQGDI